jgi:probable HAF family extracellular repeat protein
MNKFFKRIRFGICLCAALAGVGQARANFIFSIHTSSGPYAVPNVSGQFFLTYTVSNLVSENFGLFTENIPVTEQVSSDFDFTTDANGNATITIQDVAPLNAGGVSTLGKVISGSYNILLSAPGLGFSVANGSGNLVDFTTVAVAGTVSSGPFSGRVISGNGATTIPTSPFYLRVVAGTNSGFVASDGSFSMPAGPSPQSSQVYLFFEQLIGTGGTIYAGVPASNNTLVITPPSFVNPLPNIVSNENATGITIPHDSLVNNGSLFGAIAAVSSNPSIIPNDNISVSSQSLTMVPVPGAVGTTTITLTATDGYNLPVTGHFTVTINARPQSPVAGMPVALNFNGTNNGAVIHGFGNYAPTSEVTIEFWQNTQQINNQSTLILSNDNTADRLNIQAPSTNGLYGTVVWDFGNVNAGGHLTYQLQSTVQSKWTHFAFVSSQVSNYMAIYINGVRVAFQNTNSSFTPQAADLLLGSSPSGGKPFAGGLSELRIWNVARNPSQILTNMNNPLVGNESGLIAYYRFNENSGITLFDSTANAHNGGITGDAPYPAWIAAPTNFQYYTFQAFSANNPIYTPGFLEDHSVSSLTWTKVADSSGGTLTQGAGGQWQYTPAIQNGSGTFSFAVNSGPGTLSATNTVFITVVPLSPPILSSIGPQITQENVPTQPILFTVTDGAVPVNQLTTNISSDNQTLIPASAFSLSPVATNGNTVTYSLIVTPAVGRIGAGHVFVTFTDTHLQQAQQTFVLTVSPKPAYTIVDLGTLAGKPNSFGTGINNNGQVVGYSTDNTAAHNQAFYYTGLTAGSQLVALNPSFNQTGTPPTTAYSINALGQITGTAADAQGNSHVFFYDSQGVATLTNFGTLGGFNGISNAAGFAINDNGNVVGQSTASGGGLHAFQSAGQLIDLTSGPLAGSFCVATGINDSNNVVGYYLSNGVTNAFLITPTNVNGGLPGLTNSLGGLATGSNSWAYAINQFGDIVGAGAVTGGAGAVHGWLRVNGSGANADLGVLPGTTSSVAYGLNASHQVVGDLVTSSGVTHAFFYSIGVLNDLNNLIPIEETNTWTLVDARGINDSGAIVGTGIINGQNHAFLALPANVIGQPIPRPLGTLAQQPAINIINPGETDDTSTSCFYWSSSDQQLYAIRPVTATIHFPLPNTGSGLSTNVPTVDVTTRNVWPRNAQTHVVGAPVQVVPQGLPSSVSFNYQFNSLIYSTNTGAVIDQTGLFGVQNTGYTVVQYLVTGAAAQPTTQNSPSYFTVVRSVAWNNPGYLTPGVPATIGTPITNQTHFDYANRNGYVLFSNCPVDGLQSDPAHAYDAPTRSGPIIPVNTLNPKPPVNETNLVVVWYHTNEIGVAWADSPFSYSPAWPLLSDPTNTIVICAQNAPSVGDPQVLLPNYLNSQVYTQNNPAFEGFNPNEEHAFIAGGKLYALRSDLNSYYGNLSQPYTLLKYQDANNSNQWSIRVFHVVATTPSNNFFYTGGTAGTQIQPPPPLNIMLPLCNNNRGVSGPFYKAISDGSLWARAAGPNGQGTNIVVQLWYPLEPGFYSTNATIGECVPWMDVYGGTVGTPVNVTNAVTWPPNGFANFFQMQIGQSVTTAANGLPDITDLSSAQIIYDDLNRNGETNINLARVYDPYSSRAVPIPSSATWITKFPLTPISGTISEFEQLPYYLQIRLLYDSANNLLIWKGTNVATVAGGPPLLLNNIMSIREREMIKQILELNVGVDYPDFDSLLNQLYYLTRNPNMLTLSPPGTADLAHMDTNDLLVGLTAITNTIVVNGAAQDPIQYGSLVPPGATSSTTVSIVPQVFGQQAKALTTALPGLPSLPNPPGSTNYFTVVSDPGTPGATVQMFVIAVTGPDFVGALAVLPGNNVFDQRQTIRYTTDFGGSPDQLQFQWYYQTVLGAAPPLPTLDANSNIISLNSWIPYPPPPLPSANPISTNGFGAMDITLGIPGAQGSGLLAMQDIWWISRYTGYAIDGTTNFSGWVGQPGGGPQLAEGWVNRVINGLSPFNNISTNFHTTTSSTYASEVAQAGARFEGPIAYNPNTASVDGVGLIQAYQTVLETGKSLSIEGSPPVDDPGADATLLKCQGQISSLYTVLANEAYAEFSDPTVGFTTSSGQFGSLASSLFAFQDEVDTLLDQQLDLLRGRDASQETVTAPPVYNRLYWNFTGGNGQIAYVQTFQITDADAQGLEANAEAMFPQGHGDAWGHYLTALTGYYELLQNTNFTWTPRALPVPVGGVAVLVNYQDEQAFAHTAAQKAQTGSDIVRLTYQSVYTDDPSGQFEGYYDTDTNRAWGLSEWARRSVQGAYFDWVTVNALLPSVDTNANDTGVSKVDRTTVTDIPTILSVAQAIQSQLDMADAGLNPLGLAKQAVPFDIDPSLVDQGQTHFEQIYNRAVAAMVNAETVWDEANLFTSSLRQQQDSVNNFAQNVTRQDTAYLDRLFEIFGYPYPNDPTYPPGYTGPDIYHYMYVDATSLLPNVGQPVSNLTGLFTNFPGGEGGFFPRDVAGTTANLSNILTVQFPIAPTNLYYLQAPSGWGARQATGTLQKDISQILQDQGNLNQATADLNSLNQQIKDSAALLHDLYALNEADINIENNTTISSDLGFGTTQTDLQNEILTGC